MPQQPTSRPFSALSLSAGVFLLAAVNMGAPDMAQAIVQPPQVQQLQTVLTQTNDIANFLKNKPYGKKIADETVRLNAVRDLGDLTVSYGTPELAQQALQALNGLRNDPSNHVRWKTVAAVKDIAVKFESVRPAAQDLLTLMSGDKDSTIARAALNALREINAAPQNTQHPAP